VAYCQKELGPISTIFTEGRYQDEIVVTYDPASLSETNDPLGINKARVIGQVKQADIDNLAYEKSMPNLHGILTSMTAKEVDEKQSIHRFHLNSDSTTAISHGTPTAVVSLYPSIPYIRVRVPVGSRPGSKFRVL
jgi:hypothetical protein